MKKQICFFALLFFFFNYPLSAQDINLPSKKLEMLLCNKWESDYTLYGKTRIDRKPGVPQMIVEFKKDKTYILSNTGSKDVAKGIWSYDPKKKMIQLKVPAGGSNLSVISLKQNELVMLVDTKRPPPNETLDLKIIYKIKKQ